MHRLRPLLFHRLLPIHRPYDTLTLELSTTLSSLRSLSPSSSSSNPTSTMSLSNVDPAKSFPYQELTKIIGKPTFESVRKLKRETFQNAVSVRRGPNA